MPSILKALLRSTLPSRAGRGTQQPQSLSPGAFSNEGDRTSAYSTDELTQLTADLARKLAVHDSQPEEARSRSTSTSKSRSRSKGKKKSNFQDKLHDAVQIIEAQNSGHIDPYYPSNSQFPSMLPPSSGQAGPSSQIQQANYGYGSHHHQWSQSYQSPQQHATPTQAQYSTSQPSDPSSIPSYIPPPHAASQPSTGDEWALAFQSCSAALVSAEHIARLKTLPLRQQRLVDRCVALLDAQRDDLFAIKPWAEDKQLPMFRTLTQVYTELINAFNQISQDPQSGAGGLRTVLQVLQEGPDYLIDIGLMECIIWQAEVIDPNYGSDIRNLLDEAVSDQVGLAEFRQRLGVLMDVALKPPVGAVDDDLGRDALSAIQQLVTQSVPPVPVLPPPPTISTSPSPSNPSSPSASASSTPASSPGASPTHTTFNAQTLQNAYGTGPLPTPAASPFPSPYPSRAPSPTLSSTSTSSSQKSIFEYRGHRLTRSALELVQTQERLARADSSGQYAGEVSWDDLRNAWIPNWAEKLRVSDLAEGELADTNPANYREKRRDVWGNRIGWYEGQMYYEEEPLFELRS